MSVLSNRGWLRIAGEGALLGFLGGLVLSAWQSRLHRDLFHGTLWLATERSLPLLLGAAASGLLLSAGLHLLLGRRPALGSRAASLSAGAVALLAAVPVLISLRARMLTLLPWTSGRLALAAGTALIGLAAALVVLRVMERRGDDGPSPGTWRMWSAAAGLLLLAATGASWVGFPLLSGWRAAGRPSVILVSLDTLRADRLGFMGYGRDTSPLLDQVAAGGVVFERAVSPAPWTLPAHVSLLTSQMPNEHRVRRVVSNVRPQHLLLSECFRDAGYRTGAFTGGGYVSGDYGYDQGFEVYRDHIEAQEGWAAGVARSALDWVAGLGDRPFFLFMHTYEPHGPYLEREFARAEDQGRLTEEMIAGTVRSVLDPTEAERRFISDLYDGDIASTDRAMGGALVTWLEEGTLDRAIVVVTSDHGEDVWDHDAVDIPRHGHTLYEEIVHVPLLLRAPGLVPQGGRVDTPVSLIDVSPTLLGLAGLPVRRSMRGQDLSEPLREGREPESRPLLSEAIRYGPLRFSWRHNARKVILTPEPAPIDEDSSIIPEVVEIYNLAADPQERENLMDRPLPGTEQAVRLLMERAGGSDSEPDPEGIEKAEELKRQLRSLGYID